MSKFKHYAVFIIPIYNKRSLIIYISLSMNLYLDITTQAKAIRH